MRSSTQSEVMVPFLVQFLQEVPMSNSASLSATGTATGSDHEAGDNDKD